MTVGKHHLLFKPKTETRAKRGIDFGKETNNRCTKHGNDNGQAPPFVQKLEQRGEHILERKQTINAKFKFSKEAKKKTGNYTCRCCWFECRG